MVSESSFLPFLLVCKNSFFGVRNDFFDLSKLQNFEKSNFRKSKNAVRCK